MEKTYRLLGIITKGTGTWAVNSIIALYMCSVHIFLMTWNFNFSKRDKTALGKMSSAIRDMAQLSIVGH